MTTIYHNHCTYSAEHCEREQCVGSNFSAGRMSFCNEHIVFLKIIV